MKDLPQLESKHSIWIIDAAADYFGAEIARLELEIVRHHSMLLLQQPMVTVRLGGAQTREERLKEIGRFLDEYRKVLTVLRAWKVQASDADSIALAKALQGHLSERRDEGRK